jgi:hypothetical protein
LQVFDSVERRIIYRAETRGFLKRYAQRWILRPLGSGPR